MSGSEGKYIDFIYQRHPGGKNEDSAVVEAHGVGYQIFVPVPVLSELPPLGKV